MDDEQIGEEEKERRTQPEITDTVNVLPIGENAQEKRISIIDPRIVPAESDSEDEDDTNSSSRKLIKQQQSRSIASKANEIEVKEKTTRVQKNLSSTLKISETGKSPKANSSRLEDGEDAGKTPLRQEFNNSLKKRRSHNLSQISEGSENKNDNENEDEVFDLKEEEFIEIHGIEEEQMVTNNKNSRKNKTQTIEQTHVSISITSKSKSSVSKASNSSKKSPLLPSPSPPPPPPPPVVAEVPAKKGISSIKISKKNAPLPPPPPPPPPQQQPFETPIISHSQPPSTSNSGIGKLTKSVSSSSISSQPIKKMTSHASLRNLEEANDSKDECELQALNNQLLRRSMTRSINRTGNSTVSNSSVNTAAVNSGVSQSASQLFKPKLTAQTNTKPMPPLFNSEINKYNSFFNNKT